MGGASGGVGGEWRTCPMVAAGLQGLCDPRTVIHVALSRVSTERDGKCVTRATCARRGWEAVVGFGGGGGVAGGGLAIPQLPSSAVMYRGA
ncbi:hypothetical protein E2C01_017802 [Portunus trituberculatus]|uniref:Uncharacterized protein n=1 Tax=Portunus trituberculatus TaxID=210409 RepID=A0A5B7DUT6_PORTR|nr:hypothetical protein [Portunus trituberculatus]